MSGEVLRVVEIQGKGRALVASEALQGGQIVLRESPILLYSALPFTASSSYSYSYSYCAHCFRVQEEAVCCPDCSLERFCSPNCLSSHSPWLCQSLLRLRHHSVSSPLSPELQLQARFLLAAYSLASSPHQLQALLSLQGESTAVEASAAQFLHTLISSVCPPPPSPSGWFSLELSAALLAKDKVNAFGLMEPFSENAPRSVRAYGIYPKASFFNHDCLPNACRFDYVDSDISNANTDMIVRMIHDVPEGREICLSYFPVNEKYSSRQKRLMEDYGFACDCDRCKVEAHWSDSENEDEVDEEELMDEDVDQTMESDKDEANDFPHAYFFLRYMCHRNNCWGTLAPLPPNANVMECNVCGNLKNHEDDDG